MYRRGFKLLETTFLHHSLVMGSTSFPAKAKITVRVRDGESCFLLSSISSRESVDTSLGRFLENSG